MSSVEKVKDLCKELKIPISKLEKDLGFSNGYIGQLKKGVFPSDRLVLIANYLNVSINDLASDTEEIKSSGYYLDPETADLAQELKDRKDLRTLLDASRDLSPKQLKALITFIELHNGDDND